MKKHGRGIINPSYGSSNPSMTALSNPSFKNPSFLSNKKPQEQSLSGVPDVPKFTPLN